MKAIFSCSGLLALLFAGSGWTAEDPFASARAAEAVVTQTADSMLVLIEEAKGYAQDDPERFYIEVEALLRSVVDFRRFAGSVMATYYKKATPEQRTRFVESFKWGLVRTYGLALTEFNDGSLAIVPATRPPKSPDRVSVRQEIHTSAGQIYPVIYSMARSKEGEWIMRNIIVNGVNMGLTYRSQFLSSAQNARYGGDLDRVIDDWSQVLEADAARTVEETQAGSAATSQ